MPEEIGPVTQFFPEDFLRHFPAFRGELSPSDQAIGEQWVRVWQAAQEAMAQHPVPNHAAYDTLRRAAEGAVHFLPWHEPTHPDYAGELSDAGRRLRRALWPERYAATSE